MAYRSMTFATFAGAVISFAAPVLSGLMHYIDAFFKAVMLVSAKFDWRLESVKVIAFKAIGSLKPVYRESYDSHGLSLDPGRMRT